MKKAILIVLALTFLLPAFGQKDKNVVYKVSVGEFGYVPQEKKKATAGEVLLAVVDALSSDYTKTEDLSKYAESVRASILSGISGSWRLRATEADLTEDEINSGAPVYFADGYISNISSTTKVETNKEGKTNRYYRCQISATVNLKDPRTGEVVDNSNFNVKEDDCSWLSSQESAMEEARNSLRKKVRSHYNRKYPWSGYIIERASVKKDKQKEVYIDLGSNHGMYEDCKLNVYNVSTVAGRETRSEIGQLRVQDVQGADISLCKVTSGSDKIKSALDADKTLIVTTK